MSQTCDIEIVNEAFRSARDQFEMLILQLHTDPTAPKEHDQVEALIKKQGTEVMRLVLQGYLDVLSKHEERMDSVLGAGGDACAANVEKTARGTS